VSLERRIERLEEVAGEDEEQVVVKLEPVRVTGLEDEVESDADVVLVPRRRCEPLEVIDESE
jgi:hypothetical protein